MAKSMYEIIETGMIEVNHNGQDVEFELPAWLKEASGKLESEQDLALWADDNNVMHALLHSGIAKTIIDLRAAIRPADIAGKEKGDRIKVSLIKDEENAQKRSTNFTIKPAIRPGTGGSTKTKAEIETLTKVVQAMHDAGIEDEVIKTMQVPVFGNVKVALALNNITR